MIRHHSTMPSAPNPVMMVKKSEGSPVPTAAAMTAHKPRVLVSRLKKTADLLVVAGGAAGISVKPDVT